MKQSGDEGKVISLNHKAIAGKHCESSAILNALHYQGYEITEEQIIGAGAAPGFVYEKTAFPFLGGRSKNMRESFSKNTGIPFTVRQDSDDPRWNEIEGLLEQGIPVILRVDMRYLPYLYGGKYGPKYMSFGWHLVTLFAMDRQKGTALVTDTEHDSAGQTYFLREESITGFPLSRRLFSPIGHLLHKNPWWNITII
ncbi:MAG: BtrH N-terminal domain-containing protein [Spirochaetaceae bacterium]|nr:BtrH N-terminal domain-containing protein [Spirochaetaceae bacterium]